MVVTQIHAAALTTFDVDPDGKCVRINVRDGAGQPASLVLPTACLNQLLMTLPGMAQTALRNLHKDDSLRLVHPLKDFQVELGEVSEAGTQQLILTLATAGGFAVSFSAPEAELACLGGAISGDVVDEFRNSRH